MDRNDPGYEPVATDELARLRRIEEAARAVLNESSGRRTASSLLAAMAALRVALQAAAVTAMACANRISV